MKKLNINRGFTLIELLVVIAIIAIMSGVILVSLQSSRGKSRDGKRISDIAQIQLALEQYFDQCQQYPVSSFITADLTTISAGCPAGTNMATFISKIPSPPGSPSFTQATYEYSVNSTKTDYVLHTQIENTNSITVDGMPNTVPQASWTPASFTVACDNTSTSKSYCVGPK